jgi:nucleoside-diphosphate-sugar epimerase
MRVHVTGGSGFLGGYVISMLLERGYTVTALARSAVAADRLRALGAQAIHGDLDEPASIDNALAASEADTLVNLASLGFGHAPTIVAAAEDAGIERAVFVSTTAIFTKLDAPSKNTRVAAEDTIRSSRLRWTIIRPTMIYGSPADRNMWRLLRLLRRVPIVPAPGGGHTLQQPVHVADLADAVVAAAERDVAIGKAYDIAGPDGITFREVARAAGAAVGRTTRILPLPASALARALRAVERSGRQLPIRAEQIERLTEDKMFDIEFARHDLDYEPRPFRVGIAQEAEALRR